MAEECPVRGAEGDSGPTAMVVRRALSAPSRACALAWRPSRACALTGAFDGHARSPGPRSRAHESTSRWRSARVEREEVAIVRFQIAACRAIHVRQQV